MLLAVIMVFSLFTIVPFTAGAAVDDVLSEDDYLTFTAEADGATVTLNVSSGSNLQYNKNNSGWEDYTKGAQIDLENEGDYVRFSGTGTPTWAIMFVLAEKILHSITVITFRSPEK